MVAFRNRRKQNRDSFKSECPCSADDVFDFNSHEGFNTDSGLVVEKGLIFAPLLSEGEWEHQLLPERVEGDVVLHSRRDCDPSTATRGSKLSKSNYLQSDSHVPSSPFNVSPPTGTMNSLRPPNPPPELGSA